MSPCSRTCRSACAVQLVSLVLLSPLIDAIDATPVCRERARMREIEDGVCGAHRGNALDHSCRRRASRPRCLAKID
ncbi:hypothetical protein Ctob_007440 [Chrysochromulina tobinii]|uniref:Secreted protein n=1 Tax=Chrysochromulina tobinii TaxID=1460289 RepID=A0A0M0K1N1_9EUKA|nr:hypothetical protein Ctob_007440 [Chrysochromulina tobinii]|eukprot:KOO32477.1 hypothetical protein Ctob_007440 [Chrysochromulina sp. CCMP291]